MDFKSKIKADWPAAAILAAAALVRLLLLGMKPPHFDEGVNGWFVDQMTHTGFYHYDPTNYHGPLHFYVLFLAQTLLGRHIWALRLPMALASLAAVWFTLKFDRFIGRAAALWAAAAMAVSPGCVFYGRYAIHEYWMVLSLMLCAWGLAGLWKYGERKYLWALCAGMAGAILTKETYIIHFACAALTLLATWMYGKILPASDAPPAAPRQWTDRDLAIAIALAAGAIVFFYSGTFMDMAGLRGLYTTFAAWAKTGQEGNGHEKVWYYWFKLIGHYEWPACIGYGVALFIVLWYPLLVLLGRFKWTKRVNLFAALIAALPRASRFLRALSIYGCGAFAAYSIIHYKTPWCIVSLTWPFLLLFGCGVDFAIKKLPPGGGALAGVLSAALLAANLCDMVSLNFYHFTDPKQLYVYVQTFEDVNKLMDPLNKLVALNPSNYQLTGSIVLDSYHPLPWLLGDFPNVGYYDDNSTPPKMDADFLLVEETRIDDVESGLHDKYFTFPLVLRDAEDPSKLYLSYKKFRAIFPGRKPDFVPPTPTPAPPKAPPSPPIPRPSP